MEFEASRSIDKQEPLRYTYGRKGGMTKMANVKTAISIQKSLFNDADVLAHKMHVSRSWLFARAMRDFIQKQQNRQILQQLNMAYDDAPDSEERKWQGRARSQHQRLMEKQW